MVRTGVMMMAMALVATPALAWDGNRELREDRRDVARAAQRLEQERRDFNRAQWRGDPRDIRREARDLERAERDFYRERRDFQRTRYEERFDDDRRGRGRGNGWGPGGRPANDPTWRADGWRQPGWHAEHFYRQGNYRPVTLGRNDPVWRGYDNRYYCRRSDGTTGLIVGGLVGGTLGNVIAPGGSKLLGSIIGGSVGAVVGNSVDRNRVVCR